MCVKFLYQELLMSLCFFFFFSMSLSLFPLMTQVGNQNEIKKWVFLLYMKSHLNDKLEMEKNVDSIWKTKSNVIICNRSQVNTFIVETLSSLKSHTKSVIIYGIYINFQCDFKVSWLLISLTFS